MDIHACFRNTEKEDKTKEIYGFYEHRLSQRLDFSFHFLISRSLIVVLRVYGDSNARKCILLNCIFPNCFFCEVDPALRIFTARLFVNIIPIQSSKVFLILYYVEYFSANQIAQLNCHWEKMLRLLLHKLQAFAFFFQFPGNITAIAIDLAINFAFIIAFLHFFSQIIACYYTNYKPSLFFQFPGSSSQILSKVSFL